jgi:hypothetical protein
MSSNTPNTWFVKIDGTEYGPFSDGELKKWARQGNVGPDAEVRKGDGPWVSATKVKGLLPPPDLGTSTPSESEKSYAEIKSPTENEQRSFALTTSKPDLTKMPTIKERVADPSEQIVVLRQSGGPIRTVLSKTIVLNEESSLKREFITVIDRSLPAAIVSCVGITTRYEPSNDYSSGGYLYTSNYSIKTIEEIRAFEIRFLLFDIWGKHVRTLSASQILDMPADSQREYDGTWSLYSENEASEHYASIAFLALIRTAKGQVFEADLDPIIEEARKFESKFSDADLEPTAIPRP